MPHLHILLNSVFLCTYSLFYVTGEACPVGWIMFSGSCYFYSINTSEWAKGKEDCKNRGADLVIINNEEEQVQCAPMFV